MTKRKYVMSGGLAFSEEKDMKKLRNYSLKGWHVTDFKFMGYTLEKGERADYIYSVDYRLLEDWEAPEYYDFFASAGWAHVASEGDVHLFRADPGTTPIYSDQDTTEEKYTSLNQSLKKSAVPFILITAFAWIIGFVGPVAWKGISLTAATILSVFAFPALWTVVAAYSNKWKVNGKRGTATVIKMAPILLLLIVVFSAVFVYEPDKALSYFVSIVFGAVAVPTLIWGIMSVFTK